jgi:hypothetical protein
VTTVEHTCGRERMQCRAVSLDVELVAGCLVECAPPVGADLRADALLAKERERPTGHRAAREVEVKCPLAVAAQMKASRRVE